MLAAHRDQENLVQSHQVPTKQQPKTPGARYPKTPSRFGQNDENAPTAFAGKAGLGGVKPGGNDKIQMTKGNGFVTPMGPKSRAPLGAKTTNAKARTGQTGGVKNLGGDIEKTQLKQPTAQKPKPKSTLQIEVKNDAPVQHSNDDEPEYAPPRPTDLPYESDLLPPGGLSFEGLKDENLMRGFYQHFMNPVDDNGVSRRDKQFDAEMKAMMDKADEKNAKDLEDVGWNLENDAAASAAEPSMRLTRKPDPPEIAQAKMARKVRGAAPPAQPSTVRSRKAASTLAIPADTQKKATARPVPSAPAARRPLSSLLSRQAPLRTAPARQPLSAKGGIEALSRNTLGYNKGKTASSLVHSRTASQPTLSGRSTKTPTLRDSDAELTITPARARQNMAPKVSPVKDERPQFMAIFEPDGEEDDLPPVSGPMLSDDEDEEFELKLDI